MEVITPPPVQKGDAVAVVAPSATQSAAVIEIGVRRLRELFELDPVVYPTAAAEEPLSPSKRADDIHGAFESDATAVIAITGGEDEIRVLKHLDLDLLRGNPTRYFGISDNTNVHAALAAAGVVSYYGGQFVPGIACDGTLPAYTRRYLERALFDDRLGDVEPSETWTDGYFHFGSGEERTWEPNEGWAWDMSTDEPVTGRVWGGCLTVLTHLLAADRFVPTPRDVDGWVLALETSELLPERYHVQSAIRCLEERDLLDRFAAILVGRPKTRHKEPRSDDERNQYRRDQRAAIRDACDEYVDDLPIVFDLDFGHTDPHVPIPISGNVTLDPVRERIHFA